MRVLRSSGSSRSVLVDPPRPLQLPTSKTQPAHATPRLSPPLDCCHHYQPASQACMQVMPARRARGEGLTARPTHSECEVCSQKKRSGAWSNQVRPQIRGCALIRANRAQPREQ